MADPNLKITVSADTSKADAALSKLQQQGEKISKAYGVSPEAGQQVANLSNKYTELNQKLELVQKVYQSLKAMIQPAIDASKQEEQSIVALTAALRDQGNATDEILRINNKYAESMARKIGVDDDVIRSIQAQIAGLTELSGTALNDATKATLQYAEVTNKSYDSAARVVTSFLTGATPKIRGLNLELDKNANVNDKIAKLLDVTSAGYGRLTDKAKTFEGTQARVGVGWDNFLEAMGRFTTQSPVVTRWLNDIAMELNWVADASDWMYETASKAFNAISDLASKLGNIIKNVLGGAFDWIVEKNQQAWDAIVSSTQSLYDKLVGHSIIPDMVDAIIAEYGRMNDVTREEVQKNFEIINGGVYQNIPIAQSLINTDPYTGRQQWNPNYGQRIDEHRYIGPVPGGTAERSGYAGGGTGARGTESDPIYVIIKAVQGNVGDYSAIGAMMAGA